ncbi:hypothetical protein [Thermococcus sp. MV5]|uniref:hypothetical protein n=1 Tax=Thermococcus sp. MV5 TaxID=1638272 RepID=UPI00143B1F04|nr:hypothetical protein [Thermococcus sp. MV5]
MNFQREILLTGKRGFNTYNYLLQKGILVVNGAEFLGLDSSYVRIRIPEKAELFIKQL